MNTKLHAVTDANGRPLSFFITAGQISDYTGAAALLDDLPKAQWMLADRGYDAEWFRDALEQKGIKPCIPGRKSRSMPVQYDKRRYKRRNRIEIMFGPPQGLAPRRNPLRSVSNRLLHPRAHRHRALLALINDPEPSCSHECLCDHAPAFDRLPDRRNPEPAGEGLSWIEAELA